jgi:hypothetical protein
MSRRTAARSAPRPRAAETDREKSQRVMQAMLQMKKIDIDALERAAAQA